MARLPLSAIEHIRKKKAILIYTMWMRMIVSVNLIFQHITIMKKRNVRQRYTILKLERSQYIHRLIHEGPASCVENLRMDKGSFYKLCSILESRGYVKESKHVTIVEKVAMFLYILGNHAKMRGIHTHFQRSKQSISRFFHEVLNGVLRLQGDYFKKPEPIQSNSTDNKWKYFKNCLGALDGTHIKMNIPLEDKPKYRNRKVKDFGSAPKVFYVNRSCRSKSVASLGLNKERRFSSGNGSEAIIRHYDYAHVQRRTNSASEISFGETHHIYQSSSLQHWFKNWQEQRKYKLTASTFAGAIGLWPRRRVQLWLEKIGHLDPFTGNLATCWNNIKEEEALERYKLITGNDVRFPEFQVYRDSYPEYDWLAASPDGTVEQVVYELSSRGVLEIKCPFFYGNMLKARPWTRIPLHYIPQAQGLLEILDRDWMDFYVWTPNGSSLFRVERDEEYWNLMKIALSDFWWNHVHTAREECLKRVITDPLYQLRAFRPAPRHELSVNIVYESKRLIDESKLMVREIHGKIQD